MAEVSLLLIGDRSRAEFREACRAIAKTGRVTAAPDVDAALRRLGSGRLAPEVVVLLQAYPAQFPAEDIERLRRAVPLARLVGLLGSWCEGEMRSGNPTPAAVRVYWHHAPPRFDRELRCLRDACGGAWSLPLTATEEERLLADADRPVEQRPGLIAIHTDRFEMEVWLSSACRRRGGSTVWLRPPRPARVEGAVAAIYDGPEGGEGHFDGLSHLAATLGRLPSGRPVPILALLGFPRTRHHRRALAAGATAVLSKPANLDDLYWHLDRLMDEGLAPLARGVRAPLARGVR